MHLATCQHLILELSLKRLGHEHYPLDHLSPKLSLKWLGHEHYPLDHLSASVT